MRRMAKQREFDFKGFGLGLGHGHRTTPSQTTWKDTILVELKVQIGEKSLLEDRNERNVQPHILLSKKVHILIILYTFKNQRPSVQSIYNTDSQALN